MKNIKIALVQTDIKWHDIEYNLEQTEKIISGIKNDVSLIILPEMFTTGFTMEPEKFAENMETSQTIKEISKWSALKKADISGSIILRQNGNCFNMLKQLPFCLKMILPEISAFFKALHLLISFMVCDVSIFSANFSGSIVNPVVNISGRIIRDTSFLIPEIIFSVCSRLYSISCHLMSVCTRAILIFFIWIFSILKYCIRIYLTVMN